MAEANLLDSVIHLLEMSRGTLLNNSITLLSVTPQRNRPQIKKAEQRGQLLNLE